MKDFCREIEKGLLKRLREPRKFIQVLYGPRQVGKTTMAHQVADEIGFQSVYGSADAPTVKDNVWIEEQWEIARLRNRERNKNVLLILDEIQKIPKWSEVIKKLWDEDTREGRNIRVLLLGSSPLLIQTGLTESLAGRFEINYASHWSYLEMKKGFRFSLEEYIFYGGYPGAASLIKDVKRWRSYILNSLVETTISRDILLMKRVDKPALLRRLFELACEYSGQILSYQKMLGQLQDAGNTTTLAHYLELLHGAGMVAGISKYSGAQVRKRGSSPKLQVLNTALIAAQKHRDLNEVREDLRLWGRFVEAAIGAHLLNSIQGTDVKLYYWREGNLEVDFVLERGKETIAIEVKSGARRDSLPGMKSFSEKYNPNRKLLVGADGISVEEFLSRPVEYWF